ncbi:hypothetical protein GRI42_02250 [Erythrobacter gaetbuli]|uniref:Uncharacterized protein n=1 Tax=Qipengyuania gaetbuli TaxID=266952 RepID=A0A844XX00_9SPHN|nr:hypothetical protein [Qipengyuania gaetbuli]MXO50124.1 hypothetical protein [Qipengyuania gaetbuli]
MNKNYRDFSSVGLLAILLSSPAIALAQTSEDRQASASAPDKDKSLEAGGRLDLVCGGAGTANKTTVLTGNSSSTYSGSGGFVTGSTNATVYGTRQQGFGDQVALFIENGEGRVRMPRAMLPVFRGGEDGWFKLGDIEVKENEITATVRVNFINNPKLRVDRYTGAISISGKAGDYSGQCQRFVPEETERQF